jgi:hypothetical protein
LAPGPERRSVTERREVNGESPVAVPGATPLTATLTVSAETPVLLPAAAGKSASSAAMLYVAAETSLV